MGFWLVHFGDLLGVGLFAFMAFEGLGLRSVGPSVATAGVVVAVLPSASVVEEAGLLLLGITNSRADAGVPLEGAAAGHLWTVRGEPAASAAGELVGTAGLGAMVRAFVILDSEPDIEVGGEAGDGRRPIQATRSVVTDPESERDPLALRS